MATSEVEDAKRWEEVLRKMLPAGAPLPDEEQLDYSIAVEYERPPVPYQVPKVDPLDLDSISIRSSSVLSGSDCSQVIPVVVPIVSPAKFSRFNRGINGGSKESESWRSSSVEEDLAGRGEEQSNSLAHDLHSEVSATSVVSTQILKPSSFRFVVFARKVKT